MPDEIVHSTNNGINDDTSPHLSGKSAYGDKINMNRILSCRIHPGYIQITTFDARTKTDKKCQGRAKNLNECKTTICEIR